MCSVRNDYQFYLYLPIEIHLLKSNIIDLKWNDIRVHDVPMICVLSLHRNADFETCRELSRDLSADHFPTRNALHYRLDLVVSFAFGFFSSLGTRAYKYTCRQFAHKTFLERNKLAIWCVHAHLRIGRLSHLWPILWVQPWMEWHAQWVEWL